MKNTTQIAILIAGFLAIVILISCINPTKNNNDSQNKAGSEISKIDSSDTLTIDTAKTEKLYKVTFVELGSVKCIPCKKMQPIMKSIEEKYGEQVKVVFHDVWTPEGQPFGDKFGINAIPTQVFLDEKGKEFFRHEGFFPEEEIIAILKEKGVK